MQSTKTTTKVPSTPVVDDGQEARMSIFEHLDELRQRFMRAFLALAVGTIIGFIIAGTAFEFLLKPYCQISTVADCRLQVLGPTEGVISYFRVSLMIGGILAIPLMTYQLMMFVLPGLTRREKRFVIGSLPVITFLFLVGVVFAWFILTPPALGFLQGFQPTLFKPEWTADLYLSFITALIFWMGVAFETPLVFFVFSVLGFVEAKTLVKNWRIAVVVSAVAAAMITPTIDPVNMFLVMGPLLGLYTLSIVLVFFGRRLSGVEAR